MIKLGAFVAKEVREVMPATILFLFLFHMVVLTKAVSLGDYSSVALRATTATLGALIVAKAILVVEALPISRRFSSHRAMVEFRAPICSQDWCPTTLTDVRNDRRTCMQKHPGSLVSITLWLIAVAICGAGVAHAQTSKPNSPQCQPARSHVFVEIPLSLYLNLR